MDPYRIDGHKLHWHLDRVLAWQRGETVVPIYVEVSPVSYCNHRCIFCGIDFAMKSGVKLETGLTVQRLKEMGALGVRSIMFAGEGEPLLHPDFAQLVHAAKGSGIDVSITTNGSVGDPNFWESMLSELSWIRFSVDAGTPDVHSKIHGIRPEAYQAILDNLSGLLSLKEQHRLPVTVGVQFLMIEENLKDIRNALDRFSAMGVDYVSLKPYSLHPQMLKRKNTLYEPETIRSIDGVIERFKTENQTATAVIYRRDALQHYSSRQIEFGHCRALPFWGYVSSAGDFYTCSVFIHDPHFKVGSIYQQNMKDIFFGEARRKSVEFGEKDLEILQKCRLNCRMARINEFLQTLAEKPEHLNFI